MLGAFTFMTVAAVAAFLQAGVDPGGPTRPSVTPASPARLYCEARLGASLPGATGASEEAKERAYRICENTFYRRNPR
jgi:hypothetical protein